MTANDELYVIDDPKAPPARPAAHTRRTVAPVSESDLADLVVIDVPLPAAAKTPTMIKLENEIEELLELQKQGRANVGQEEEDIASLAQLVAENPEHDPLPRTNSRGDIIPSGRRHELAQRRARLSKAKEKLAAIEPAITAKRRQLADLVDDASAAALTGPIDELRALAHRATERAVQIQQAAVAFGDLLRGQFADEQRMADLGNTDRGRNMLSLRSFKSRLAYALHAVGAFEVNPSSVGMRGANVFIALDGVDPTSAWRGKSLHEIDNAHFGVFIRETCRGF